MLRVIPKDVVIAYLRNLLANEQHNHRIIDMLNVVENSRQYYWKKAWRGIKPGYQFMPVVQKSDKKAI
ncbi:hypothetical protein [Acetilactobacillus jinshanensis]|uniref:Uncharacterized protein n=1 Tax=Acetilactobacillus jinshanensis TaxID=1720083 RepID=A0A4P6ZM51_9LACO|nr:hypothetical protein [Acetilactobacillus jinshanensis]QBP18310.1 hypothetical protein ELX58_03980 [Acetilactobacillus jinshanensis]URL61175.1 hypothetical protein HGK75_04045 [uncultured bacterium]